MPPEPHSQHSLSRQLTAFEMAWQQGAPPEIADFLPADQEPAMRRGLLVQLVMLDLEMRWRRPTEPAATVDLMHSGARLVPLPVRSCLDDYTSSLTGQ